MIKHKTNDFNPGKIPTKLGVTPDLAGRELVSNHGSTLETVIRPRQSRNLNRPFVIVRSLVVGGRSLPKFFGDERS